MSGKAREEMVLDLELEATVEPVHPLGALYVHSAFQLKVEPFVVLYTVGVWEPHESLHGEVAESYLNVEDSRNTVRNQQVHPSLIAG